MADFPYFTFFPADYMADGKVQLCTTAQEGIYLRLLCFAWMEGSIPDSVEQVALACKRDARKTDIAHVMKEFFIPAVTVGRLINSRLEIEREVAQEKSEKASKAGHASVSARRRKKQERLNGTGTPRERTFNSSSEKTPENGNSNLTIQNQNQFPPNPQMGDFNSGRRKRDQYPPMPDRSPDAVKAWIQSVAGVPRDKATVTNIIAAAARIENEDELFHEIERIAKGSA